jgi:hypothetical protein
VLRATCLPITTSRDYVIGSGTLLPTTERRRGATVGQSGYPFRIDNDEKFNETTYV